MSGPDAASLLAELRGEVDDERVLAAIAAVPRERFVPAGLAGSAYANHALPIGDGQTISQPLVVALMCAALDPQLGERVLDVGTGSGWHAAVLARLVGDGGRVWSIERHPGLAATATAALAAAGIGNVACRVGDGSRGLPAHAPYDAINVAAACDDDALEVFEAQLAPGGRLIAPVRRPGDARHEELVLSRRPVDGGACERRVLGPVRFVPLVAGEPGPG